MALPTQYQRTSGKLNFTNADLEKPSMAALGGYDPKAQAASEQANYDNHPLNGLDLKDWPMEDATETLNDPNFLGRKFDAINAHDSADANAEAAQTHAKHEQYRALADTGFGVAGMMPGPIGIAGRLGSGVLGAYDMSQEGPNLGNAMQVGMSAIDVLPALRALKGMQAESRIGRTNIGLHGPENAPMQGASRGPVPYKFNGQAAAPAEAESVQAMREPQKLLMANNPLDGEIVPQKQLTAGARPMPASPDPSYVKAVQGEYPESMQSLRGGEADLTGELNSIGIGTSHLTDEAIAQARAKERFGRNFQSESSGMPHWGPQADARLAPGEEQGVEELGKLLDSIHGEDWAPKGNGLYKEPSIAPMAKPADLQRQSALDAIADERSIGNTKQAKGGKKTPITHGTEAQKNVLFGGATSQTHGTEGEYVRPKHRYPIGSGSPRVTPREKNVTWNQ